MNKLKFGRILGVMATLCCAFNVKAAQSTYLNDGQVLFAPQVDATNFINNGYINIFTGLPFQTRSTRSYINLGEMNGVPGFDLQLVTPSNARQLAASFANGPSGIIRAQNPMPLGSAVNAVLSIRATNIVNQGELSSDVTGVVRLEGKSVNLTRSSVGIRPITGGVGTNGANSFSPDVGVNDSWWAYGTSGANTPLATLVTQGSGGHSRVASPLHTLTNQNNQTLPYQLILNDALPFASVTQPNGSNFVIQGVFVQRQDPRLNINVRFAPSSDPSNLYQTAVVQFSRNETNSLTGLLQPNNIYLIDELGSGTNIGLSTNVSSKITFKPANYIVTRETTPLEWLLGTPASETDSRFLAFQGASGLGANSIPSLFYNSSYTNNMGDLGFSAYHFYFTNVISALPAVTGASMTNQAGRVEITADTLDLTRARIRADGVLNLNAKAIITSNTVIDVPNLALNLNPPSGNLVISNLVRATVDRTTGPLMAWSAVWSNNAIVVTSSFGPDTNNPDMFVELFATNNATIQFHILMVDSRQVATTLPVYVSSLNTSSTNLTIYDTMRLNERVDVRSKALTVAPTGNLIMSGLITNWNTKIFTNLDSLTNRGRISFGGSVSIGVAPAQRFQRVVNSGQIGGVDFAIRTAFFENSGSISRANITAPSIVAPPALLGAIRIDAAEARLVGGQIGDAVSAGAISIAANNLTLSNQSITTPSSVTLTITNRITDSGGSLITSRGVHLVSTPRSGDLLGTTINSSIPARFGINVHTWSGRDRGPQIEGFTNNAALGRLILRGNTLSLHEFKGADIREDGTTTNALYVKVLELQNMLFSQIQDLIQLDGDFKIYFQDATPFTPAQIDQIGSNYFGGRLKWVAPEAEEVVEANARSSSTPAPSPSSADLVTVGAAAVSPNEATSSSSPAQSVAGLKFSSVSLAGSTPEIRFSWMAAPMTSYVLEFASDLQSADWQPLDHFQNTSGETQTATLKDSTSSGIQRFYRLRISP